MSSMEERQVQTPLIVLSSSKLEDPAGCDVTNDVTACRSEASAPCEHDDEEEALLLISPTATSITFSETNGKFYGLIGMFDSPRHTN